MRDHAEMSYPNVFSPLRIGGMTVRNRIASSPMLSGMASHDGFVTGEMIRFYQSFARGGAAIVNIGDTAIDFDYARGHFGQLNLGDDRVVPGLNTLAEAVQKYGAKISIELNHPGRLSPPRVIGGRSPIGPSSIPSALEEAVALIEGRSVVPITEMDQNMIDQVVENFAAASHRCLNAGFETVMIHGAHGHLLSQFVSPYSNKRTDRYGGTLENRARFVMEVLEAIRRRVGDKLALEYRISADEIVPEGMHEEETIEFIRMIEDKIDLIHVSVGMIADLRYLPYMAQPTYFPHGYNVERAARIKRAVVIPVVCVGSIMDLKMAERIIAEGKAAMVAMGRAHVADPDIVNKSYHGEEDDVRPCVRCNTCGEKARDFFPVRCAVNPVVGREAEYGWLRPAEKRKKVVIVGGGPAGMLAAITTSSRGHDVTLFEKEAALGGALRMASGPSFKGDMKRYLEYLVRKTTRSGATIRLRTKATAMTISAEKPDVLIIALGAEPVFPDIPGVYNPNVFWVGEVNLERAQTGDRVIVAGAGLTGCETALHLAQQGAKVTIIDMLPAPEIAKDGSLVGKIALMELLGEHRVEIKTEVTLKEITGQGAIVVDKDSQEDEIAADMVVLSLGVTPRYAEVEDLRGLAREIYLVGDCSSARNLMAAIHNAFTVAAEI